MDLTAIGRQLLIQNAAARKGERVLVVTDDRELPIGQALYAAAGELGCSPALLVTPPSGTAGEEPAACVAAAMLQADLILCPTTQSLTHTAASVQAAAAGARVITMPSITEEMFAHGAITADYEKVEALTMRLTERLSKASWARLVTGGGQYELNICLEGRQGVPSTGMFRRGGLRGNLPSGEAYIAPVEGRSHGKVLVDGSMVGVGLLRSPLLFEIRDGNLWDLQGEEAPQLAVLKATPENGNLCELGIGANDKARLQGVILEDEKVFGTVHVAFGTNVSFGGTTKAGCHMDGVIRCPDLELDGCAVLRQGQFAEELLK